MIRLDREKKRLLMITIQQFYQYGKATWTSNIVKKIPTSLQNIAPNILQKVNNAMKISRVYLPRNLFQANFGHMP